MLALKGSRLMYRRHIVHQMLFKRASIKSVGKVEISTKGC